ncbi:DUF169 domain-containing protein [Methanolobus bombayensis]|uniref:DUF169 domain-containing protein n=1 Tax=Methanolobus bombayensis TaxID=38023 RepID=UPI001AE43641|nr:DUF169 domain-containing protein [Methanolobus bombayensis]MBP1908753.1 uncharacterized protein (DUF169 family) [Methanolobus bombayensis]
MNNEDIQKYGNELKEILQMTTSPVAVHLVRAEEEIPEDIPHIGETTRHCQMVDNVRRLGTQFYSTIDDQMCKGGASVMGLAEMSPKLRSGEVYYNLNHFASIDSAKSTMEKVPMVEANSVKAVVYAPLEKATFKPDVVLIIAKPKQVMELSQALLHREGGRVNAGFAGKQSVCADGVAYPYLTGEAGVTIGCSGSRKYTEIQDEEMIMSVPVDMLPHLVESAKSMFGTYAC